MELAVPRGQSPTDGSARAIRMSSLAPARRARSLFISDVRRQIRRRRRARLQHGQRQHRDQRWSAPR